MPIILAGLLLTGVAAAERVTFVIGPGPDARLTLEIEKTGFLRGRKHVLVYQEFEGRLIYDPHRPENSTVSLTIQAADVTLKDDWVKSGDQKKIVDLAVKETTLAGKHPRMTFSSTAIAKGPEGRYQVDGELVIRGIARPAQVFVTMQPDSNGGLKVEGTARLRLTDYGIKPPSAALGTVGTKDEMTLSFSLQAAPGGLIGR